MKIYSDEEKKYGGEMYDVLSAKLQIFYDYCNKVSIRPQYYYYAFSAMLKGRASTFYYDRIQGRQYNFEAMVQLMRAHFENDETRQLYLSKWRETTF